MIGDDPKFDVGFRRMTRFAAADTRRAGATALGKVRKGELPSFMDAGDWVTDRYFTETWVKTLTARAFPWLSFEDEKRANRAIATALGMI